MRTFVAVDLNSEIKAGLARLIKALAPLSPDVQWVREESMHLTLKFLGEIDEIRKQAVEEVLAEVVPRYSRFSLVCRDTGWFPPGAKSPRVLWIGVQADPALPALQNDIELRLGALGFPREDRPFHPHLTLGRVKSPRGLRPVLEELEKHKEETFGQMVVAKLTLFRSQLKPGGAEYSVLREFSLQ